MTVPVSGDQRGVIAVQPTHRQSKEEHGHGYALISSCRGPWSHQGEGLQKLGGASLLNTKCPVQRSASYQDCISTHWTPWLASSNPDEPGSSVYSHGWRSEPCFYA